MVPDPYRALHLDHSATAEEIKRAYRELARKYHPDRLQQRNASPDECQEASKQFAAISAAYSLLSDPERKVAYDHVYRYGGYDDVMDNGNNTTGRYSNPYTSSSTTAATTTSSSPSRKRKSTGIGYACTDPLAFLWTQGRIHSTRTVAGVEIPSRFHAFNGIRFAFTSGHVFVGPSGTRKYKSQTTHFVQGKKFTRTETVIVHPDGRTETVIEESDDSNNTTTTQRRFNTPPKKREGQKQQQQQQHCCSSNSTSTEPWYVHAWHGIKDKLVMCYSPSVAPE